MPTTSKKRTGEKIKQARINKGFTQKKLAELCHMYESQIRKYESGAINPKIETLQKIANALEISVLELRSDYELELEKLQEDILNAMDSFKDEVAFLNYLLSLGYKYIDTFHDNYDGYESCIHIQAENIDIPLTRDEYETLKKNIANDIEIQIYRLRKNKGL